MKYIKLKKAYTKEDVEETVRVIKDGKIAIIPTDTVYGIVADALNEEAVKKIYDLKQRKYSNPCNILVSNVEMIKKVTTGISQKEEEIMNKFFPRSIDNNI